MDEIIIFGNSSFADLVYFYFKDDSKYKVIAFTVDQEYINSETYNGLPLVPFDKVTELYPPSKYKMFIAIGYKSQNKLRAQKYIEAKKKGYNFVSYIHPTSVISKDAKIGNNCFIFENVVVQPFISIGDNVTIFNGSMISHDVKIEDNCFLASGVVIGGFTNIKRNCFLGANSTIKNNIEISEECIIGMGAIVQKSTNKKSVYLGTPAKLFPFDSSKIDI
jgi:sugar O-acyltransferase (sialic acid O-acetyltransferase NeuD family)